MKSNPTTVSGGAPIVRGLLALLAAGLMGLPSTAFAGYQATVEAVHDSRLYGVVGRDPRKDSVKKFGPIRDETFDSARVVQVIDSVVDHQAVGGHTMSSEGGWIARVHGPGGLHLSNPDSRFRDPATDVGYTNIRGTASEHARLGVFTSDPVRPDGLPKNVVSYTDIGFHISRDRYGQEGRVEPPVNPTLKTMCAMASCRSSRCTFRSGRSASRK